MYPFAILAFLQPTTVDKEPIFLSFALRKSKNKQGIEPQAVLKYGKVKITQFTFDFRREELFNCA